MALFRKKQPQQQGPQIDMQAFQAIKDKFNQSPVQKRETKLMDHERMIAPGVNAQMAYQARKTAAKGNQLAAQARQTVRPYAPQYVPTTDDVLADIDSVAGYGGQVSPYAVPMAAASLYIEENAANQPKSPWEGAFWDDLMSRPAPEYQPANEPPPVTKPYASSAGFGIRINGNQTRINRRVNEMQAAREQQELVDAGVLPMSQMQSTSDMLPYDQRTRPFVSPIPDPLDTQMFEPYTEMTRQESMEGVPLIDIMSLQQLMSGR